jgi:ABC-type antimicrobial peptide transport system permease subunit
MIKNYLKIALRILSRQNLYSLITILGLAMGLAVCMQVMLYVAHERSYDRFHANAKRIFSLKEHLKLGGQEVVMLYTSNVSGPMINQAEPEVTGYTRTRKVSKDIIVENPSIANIKFSESKMYADANFFNFFSFKLLSGDPSTALAKPFSLVISKDMAKKYFDTLNPIGKILKIKTDTTHLYTITGVAENVPSNSSIEFDFLASMLTLKMMTETASLLKPVGETIKWNGKTFKVIGVIKDMIVKSPYQSVRPSFYSIAKSHDNYVIIKLNPQLNTREALNKIETVFKQFSPATPFNYQFVDEEYAKKFASEERIGKLASSFAGLAIFISCLGLFGMASFIAEQRIKEIGVRKVLGATVFHLWALLSKDFVLLVIISLLIATPAAYCLMHNWLQNYTYRSDMVWWIFVSAGVGALVITLLTTSYQGISAALASPVKSLRSE